MPNNNLAIEYNGNVWHCHNFKQDIFYHQNRFLTCYNKNINYIAFWSDEFDKYKNYIFNIINGITTNLQNMNKTLLTGNIVNYNKNFIFFSDISTNDTFLEFKIDDFILVMKLNNNIVNDLYCSDWTKVYKYAFPNFNVDFDARFYSLFKLVFNLNKTTFDNTPYYYSFFENKRGLNLELSNNIGDDHNKIYSYGKIKSI